MNSIVLVSATVPQDLADQFTIVLAEDVQKHVTSAFTISSGCREELKNRAHSFEKLQTHLLKAGAEN